MENETVNPEKIRTHKSSSHDVTHIRRKHEQPRPVLLSVLCIFSFAFYGLISLIFLFAVFYSGWISEVRNKYLPEGTESKNIILLITVSGFLLHFISLIGSINMWRRRKSGYLMLSISTLIIAFFQLFSNRISILSTSVYITLIVLFGIYYRRFH
jgi:magnesium-transporting ATPase (P-type)